MSVRPATWRAVHDEVVRRITAREWRSGQLIPGEVALAREFGVARATVNRALREVAEAGLLDRRRRAGTRVANHPVHRATLRIPILRREVEAAGGVYGYRLLSRDRAAPPAEVAARMRLDPAAALLRVRSLHQADGQPFAHEDRWIHEAAAPDVAEADFSAVSANEWLVRNAPFTDGALSLSAVAAEGEAAEVLSAERGAPLLMVERVTWNGAQPITFVRLTHAPGRRLDMAM